MGWLVRLGIPTRRSGIEWPARAFDFTARTVYTRRTPGLVGVNIDTYRLENVNLTATVSPFLAVPGRLAALAGNSRVLSRRFVRKDAWFPAP